MDRNHLRARRLCSTFSAGRDSQNGSLSARCASELRKRTALAHIGTEWDGVVITSVGNATSHDPTANNDATARPEEDQGRLRADWRGAVVEFSGEAIISTTLDGIISTPQTSSTSPRTPGSSSPSAPRS